MVFVIGVLRQGVGSRVKIMLTMMSMLSMMKMLKMSMFMPLLKMLLVSQVSFMLLLSLTMQLIWIFMRSIDGAPTDGDEDVDSASNLVNVVSLAV